MQPLKSPETACYPLKRPLKLTENILEPLETPWKPQKRIWNVLKHTETALKAHLKDPETPWNPIKLLETVPETSLKRPVPLKTLWNQMNALKRFEANLEAPWNILEPPEAPVTSLNASEPFLKRCVIP